VPPELDRITLKALAPDLKERYARCEDLRLDLATFLAQNYPATDTTRLATFLHELYSDDEAAERTERETLIVKAREWYSTKHAAPPPTPKTAPPPPPSGPPTAPEKPKSDATAEARERGRAFTGYSVDDHRERRMTVREPTGKLSESGISLTDSQNSGGLSTAVLGTVIGGRYYVRKLCGEGGMGRVYEAEHIDIGRRVALKILHPAYSQTPDLVERLRREARAASKISHPNVVDVTDSGTTADGAFFFVMEYLQGIELGELIYREKRLDIRRTLMIGTQICRALQAAHEVNVIHRDLKPENVLILRRDGQPNFVKVLDFGIAKSGADADLKESQGGQRRLTHPGMTMGTPEYMAPEQAAGKPADPRSDVYAVGGLLYEMLTGNPPYEGANFMEILHKKANSMPATIASVRQDVPAQLEAVIMRAMAKDPAERPPSMEALEKELQNVAMLLFSNFSSTPLAEPDPSPPAGMLGALPGVAAAKGGFAQLRAWDRKTKTVVAAGAALGLALAFIWVGRASRGEVKTTTKIVVSEPAVTAPPPVVAPPPAVVQPPTVAPPPAVVKTIDPADEETGDAPDTDTDVDTTVKTKNGRGSASGNSAESRRQLAEGERMLRAERFAEARGIFEKLTKSKRERGAALVGLAEISFQEKKYADAARTAEKAAERGGGVKARVLLGDAHFRLAHYKDAAKAYEDALKIDPGNASAKSGLALANKRM
jgi:serine/threonine-protein kinase